MRTGIDQVTAKIRLNHSRLGSHQADFISIVIPLAPPFPCLEQSRTSQPKFHHP
jgi:hypothetical protein